MPRRPWQRDLPTAVSYFEAPSEAAVGTSQGDANHDLLKRLFGEERRRTKTIPYAFGERTVLKLMYAALIRASDSWRGVKVTE